ncbi:efflux transporter outer membrane subunit [Lentisphaera profundi]|uniref:Efflux transporter outer membrane subunit n=1 Tax=Lentisphaera profundi TaxID=1658616 RepID=A0ABY7VUM0_9BACT|nr:efflux transporter outer membrane subunit [Lentisphaera profundi]WDE97908.1 efflux transporter outer membrane subunit [Lentisphaera profundi]
MPYKHLIICVFLVACNNIERDVKHRPEFISPKTFSEENLSPVLDITEKWWLSLNDSELNDFMDKVFSDNLDLAQSWARLRQAEARLGISRSDQKSKLDGIAEAQGNKRKVDGNDGKETSGSEEYKIGLKASYEIDLWDRISDQTSASEMDYESQKLAVHSTALLLSAEVVESWMVYKAISEQLDLLNQQIKTNEQSLDIIAHRQRRGLANIVDLFQQRQQVARVKSLIPNLEEQRDRLRLKLILLSGQNFDTQIDLGKLQLPQLKALPNSGIPSEILSQRPDVQQSWFQLQSSEFRLSGATKAKLPRLTLSAQANFNNQKFSRLFDNWFSNIMAGLTAPILDGGLLESEELLAKAKSDENYLNYKETALRALNEVEQALNAEKWRAEEISSVKTEVDYAKNTLDETRRRYRKGLSDYLPVLTALATHQQAQRTLTEVRAQLIVNRIEIHRSLGGSWDLEENMKLLPEAVKRNK